MEAVITCEQLDCLPIDVTFKVYDESALPDSFLAFTDELEHH
jgi:hypothetical protein